MIGRAPIKLAPQGPARDVVLGSASGHDAKAPARCCVWTDANRCRFGAIPLNTCARWQHTCDSVVTLVNGAGWLLVVPPVGITVSPEQAAPVLMAGVVSPRCQTAPASPSMVDLSKIPITIAADRTTPSALGSGRIKVLGCKHACVRVAETFGNRLDALVLWVSSCTHMDGQRIHSCP